MIDHISIGVTDLNRSTAFYDGVLKALGYVRVWRTESAAGYGLDGSNDRLALFVHPTAAAPGKGFHIAFRASSNEKVTRFHAAGLQLGGVDAGAPGLRPNYSPTYFAAFVLDPDGTKLEAVCQ